jgi:glyoxylase-like metal-dependent hydrolase (beta-lactamase superfamily II)
VTAAAAETVAADATAAEATAADATAAEATAAEATAASAGVHRLAIPTPFAVGRVNCYLIEDEPLTLVDCGPNSATALDCLEAALAVHGRKIEEIELLLITHQHVDHLGLGEIVARRSGAEVAALAGLAGDLDRWREAGETQDRFGERIMREHGVADDLVCALRPSAASIRAWGSAVKVTRPLADGDRIELAHRTLTALHRPGHSPSDTVFHDPQRRMLLAGDHLIEHISSNPIAAPPLGAEPRYAGPRPRALIAYLDSLQRTGAMELDLVLPGHGQMITNHAALIDARRRMHARRAEKIHQMVASGPLTAHEIGRALWGDIALLQVYLTLSEVLGHTDVLVADGRLTETERNGVVHFAVS